MIWFTKVSVDTNNIATYWLISLPVLLLRSLSSGPITTKLNLMINCSTSGGSFSPE